MSIVATIGKVTALTEIEKADNLLLASVDCGSAGKWQGVVTKGAGHQVGELVEVYLQDALLPQDDPRFSFMAKYHYRVRIQTMRGAPSECLIMPIGVAALVNIDLDSRSIGEDISAIAGVTKYEKPLPAGIGGDILGNFPSFIPRTDELNWQGYEPLATLAGRSYIATLKYDGTSSTAYWYKGRFGVCSRNYELKETPGNALWAIARKYVLEDELERMSNMVSSDGIAIQWETVGPGIQGNPVGLKEIDGYAFNLYDIEGHFYFSQRSLAAIAMPMVAVVDVGAFPDAWPDAEWLRMKARGLYPNGKPREGIVIRGLDGPGEFSFKAINPDYKE